MKPRRTTLRIRALTRDRVLMELVLEAEVLQAHPTESALRRVFDRVAVDLRYWVSTKTTAEIPRERAKVHLALRPLPPGVDAVSVRVLDVRELGIPLLPEVEDTYSDNTPPTLIPPPENKGGVWLALLLLVITLMALFWVIHA